MSVDSSSEENRRLRRTMRDLVALSTLPAIWVALDPKGIAGSLADVLLNTLSLDSLYIRLATGGGVVEVVRSKYGREAGDLEAIKASVAPFLSSDGPEGPVTIHDPLGGGTLRVAMTRFGVGKDHGVLIAGSRNPDFPTEQDRLLLGVGANQTAIVVRRRAAEQETREQRERLRVTLASIGEAVLTTDLQGRVTFLNSMAESLTGWSMDEAAGLSLDVVFQMIDGDTRLPLANPVSKVLEDARVVGPSDETLLIARNRTERPIDHSAAPMRGEDGEIVGCVLVFRDLSEKKHVERELRNAGEQARTILESITDAFYALDREWRFTYVNRQAEKILDRAKADLLGKVLWDEYPGIADSEFAQAFHRAASDGVPCSVSSYYPDHARWYEIHVYPAAAGVSVYFRDVTEQKQAEKHRADLLAAAQSANRAKDEFMAMLGHELRNPLSPILTALYLLEQRGHSGGERELAVIQRQVRHLVRLIDDLLDVSRITRGKVDLDKQRIEVFDVVAQAVETASLLLEQKQHQLRIDVPRSGLAVTGDPARLAQVISNLLINAAKYTDRSGHIAIVGRRSGAEVVIHVEDNGSGIAPELLPRVFDMFVQEHQEIDRSRGGLGLGLTIVRNLVQLHGGSATAESAGAGRGSTFTVRLPASCPEGDATPAEEAPSGVESEGALAAAGGDRVRVLVVDDNEDSAEMIATFLDVQGCEVKTTHDGAAALQLMDTFVPDVALLDIGLPLMSGYELARCLRQRLARIHLVAVTGYGQESDRVRTRAAGFDAHLVKPVNLLALKEIMATVASVAQARARLT